MKKFAIQLLIISLGTFLAGGTATAATAISDAPSGEVNLTGSGGILDQLYGLSNLQRVDDPLDNIWFPANGTATFKAGFADFSQDFGYIPDLNSDGNFDEPFVSLFSVPGGTNAIGLSGPSGTLNSGNVSFIWALKPSGAPLWTSIPDQNSDTLDHMVTWRIIDKPSNWVIAWEDFEGGGDRDFNDIVVEVAVNPIPIPPAVWLFGSGILGLVGIARRKKAA